MLSSPFLDAIAGEFFGDVVGGIGLFEDPDVASDDPVAGEKRKEVVGMEGIGHR